MVYSILIFSIDMATENIIAAPFGETFLLLGLAILLGVVVVARTDIDPLIALTGLSVALGSCLRICTVSAA
jgi:hypothetical protein